MTPDKTYGRPTAARRLRHAGILLALVGFVAAGCAGSPEPSVVGTPAVTLELVAEGNKFDRDSLTVGAGSPFAIVFENRDSAPHNVSIRGGEVAVTTEVFGGPDQRTYIYPSLPAGSYTFICDVHPEMTGTLTAS
jgi:plastocyanin